MKLAFFAAAIAALILAFSMGCLESPEQNPTANPTAMGKSLITGPGTPTPGEATQEASPTKSATAEPTKAASATPAPTQQSEMQCMVFEIYYTLDGKEETMQTWCPKEDARQNGNSWTLETDERCYDTLQDCRKQSGRQSHKSGQTQECGMIGGEKRDCESGKMCAIMPGETRARCVPSDVCIVVGTCMDGKECFIEESFPARVVCR